MGNVKVVVACGKHGALPWEGDVVCEKCGAVYQTKDEKAPHLAPLVCTCGVRLMPANATTRAVLGDTAGDDTSFSAKSICHCCFERWAEAN